MFNKIWLALVALAFFVSCAKQNELDTLALQGRTMGTTYHLTLVAKPDLLDQQKLQTEIDAILEDVNDKMSTYRPNSELSLFNQNQTTDPIGLSADTSTVIAKAIELGQLTNGALDVTVGPLVNLWGFGPDGRPNRVPDEAQIEAIKTHVGLDKISLEDNLISKADPKVYVDLSSIAKGFGVDKVAQYLESVGINHYLVEIGGEMRLNGKKADGSSWRIAIEKPVTFDRAVQQVIEPGDAALATSGDYRNYFEQDGVRFSHTIDPITFKPINHKLVSVSVISKDCMTADGMATALNVMGPEKAFDFAKKHDLAVYLVVKSESGFDVKYTEQFKPYMK
ncbi:FAD:protein FMN transferase [Catenovulum sp. 2E275]|nr:FAD:protein FMN transferase [Catenovulum sp. 2E275]MCU4674899.1 FAD:protein FMN transferase [Catenovulum sp. 2E275]